MTIDVVTRVRRAAMRLTMTSLALLSIPVSAVPEDAEQPIHIRADAAELDEAKGLATYRGDVRMDQGTLRVTADTMIIELQNEQVVKITAEGNRAHYQQQLRKGESEVLADARTIVYHTQDERVELVGDAFLTQDGNEFTGQLIKYDIRAGKVDASAKEAGGVRMTLKPAKPRPGP